MKVGFNSIFYLKSIIIGCYVDDLCVLYCSEDQFEKFFAAISRKLNIVDKGPINKCLSINIEYDLEQRVLRMNQSSYIAQVLADFDLSDSKQVGTPMPPGFVLGECSCCSAGKFKMRALALQAESAKYL